MFKIIKRYKSPKKRDKFNYLKMGKVTIKSRDKEKLELADKVAKSIKRNIQKRQYSIMTTKRNLNFKNKVNIKCPAVKRRWVTGKKERRKRNARSKGS